MATHQPDAEKVVAFALDQANAEHTLLNDDWRALEVKAQGTMLIAGILMAALALALDKLHNLNFMQRLGFKGALVFLLVTVVAALITMHLRIVKMPSVATTARTELDEVGLEDPDLIERWIGLQRGVLDRYVEANRSVAEAIARRAYALSVAHLALALATGCLFGVLIGLPTGGQP